MKTHKEIAAQFKKHKSISDRGLANQRSLIRDCTAFYVGDSMDYSDSIQFSDSYGQKKRAMVRFNKIKPYVNAVAGFMVQNRREAKYVARIANEDLQEEYSSYTNSIGDYLRENANADNSESEQDKNMLIGGVAPIETCMTYGEGYASTDVNGEVMWRSLDALQVGYDPKACRQNLTDSRWVYYPETFNITEALELFDRSSEDDFEAADIPDFKGSPILFDRRTGVNYKIEDLGYDVVSEEEKTVRVWFYQWYDIEKFWRCANPLKKVQDPVLAGRILMILQTIKTENPDEDDFDPQADILVCTHEIKSRVAEALGEGVKFFAMRRKVFYTAVLSGDKVFDAYKSISQQGFTVQFKTGDRDDKNGVFMGMVQSLREPSLYYNKALTELMFVIAANSKGGVLVERDAVRDIVDFESRYAKTDSVIVVESGALAAGKIRPKKEPFIPSGYDNIIALSDAAMGDVSGIDKAFLGSSENRAETALLQRRRVKQVISTLACYFDSISLYQKENARILLDFMAVFAENNPGMLIPVVGVEGKTRFLELSKDPLMAEYSVSVQEAPTSAEEKAELAMTASSMGTQLLSVGDIRSGKALMSLAVKYSMFDADDKKRISDILTPEDEQPDPAYVQQLEAALQQAQSEQSQVYLAKQQSEVKLNEARVLKERAAVHKTSADTVKSLAEANQTEVETGLAGLAENVSVTI